MSGRMVGIASLTVVLLFPLAVVSVLSSAASARPLEPKPVMKNLELAIRGYQTEYNRLPSLESPPSTEDNTEGYDTTSERGRSILNILMAKDTPKNPRRITFYDPPAAKEAGGGYTAENGLVDVWGIKGYLFFLDYNGDGKILDPEHPGATISASVIIYCAGADGDYSTWDDNVASWERRR